jgi:hypothetical protein
MIRLTRVLGLLGIVVVLPAPAIYADYLRLPVNGYLAGRMVSTTVDSPLAKYYLERTLPTAANSRNFDQQITDIEQRFKARPLDWSTLRELSRETSPDFATLFFVERSLSERGNDKFQEAYLREVRRLRRAPIARSSLRRYKFLFVPGFHYRTDPSSGADFRSQREWFRQLGLHVQLAATQEDGTIAENAAIIADIIRIESRFHTPLIVVSTSKAGPETALALGKLLEPSETASVKAWLSVGGLIHGTLLADQVMSWPKSWVARILFSASGSDPRSLPELTTAASRPRMTEIRLPRHIFTLEFIAVPLSGQIGNEVRSRYVRLRKYGPNDGLTLLADELLPNGVSIIEPGLDHFYRDPEIDLKSLAIANIVADGLEREGRGER